MRERLFAAVDAGTIGVQIDRVRARATGPSAVEVLGHLTNVPDFVDADGRLARDASGGPRVADGAEGIHTVPFRVLVPSGAGDYRVAMWGHGTGGDEADDSFDAEITGNGAAKVNIRFNGLGRERRAQHLRVVLAHAPRRRAIDGGAAPVGG